MNSSIEPTLLLQPREGVPKFVDTPSALAETCRQLKEGNGPLAVDVERASGFRYGQRACLIQLRRDGSGTHLIDPLAFSELSLLQEAIGTYEWVLHAADQDLPGLTEVGLNCPRLFDTELAARLLGQDHVGLVAVCEEELGLTLSKEHQVSDWSIRPLPATWLTYAALDVELLVELREKLAEKLAEKGRLEWAYQEFEHIRTAPPKTPKLDPWRKSAGGKIKDPRGLEYVRQLWNTREKLAQQEDLAPGRLLRNSGIQMAALKHPRNRQSLLAISEFRNPRARQYTSEWLQALSAAHNISNEDLPPARPPHIPGRIPDPRSWYRHNAPAAANLAAVKTTIQTLASEIGLPQENLLAPAVQRSVAWNCGENPTASLIDQLLESAGARPWQIANTAPKLAEALTGLQKPQSPAI